MLKKASACMKILDISLFSYSVSITLPSNDYSKAIDKKKERAMLTASSLIAIYFSQLITLHYTILFCVVLLRFYVSK